ncbi:MAG TPA: CaiB/BaiF CoA-transferase family protein [Solirubrobacterales bacterium]|nr:CaiB/BaiF CoA-transferase family protein [Solirubrobacterales bacterium]
MLPLSGIKVLDFSTLLPGPLATLIMAGAGAEVTKVERPGSGDEMRSYEPKLGESSVNFALLNRGKRSVALDLKDPAQREQLDALVDECDVLVEQFRPGVMARLGLDYESVAARNPGVVYCSISGYGQSGPRAQQAAHDLNYVADSGMLNLVQGADGAPVLPPALLADIGGGSYPAVINVALALFARERSGKGTHLDIAMSDNVYPFLYWALGNAATGTWPRSGEELVTGGSPRYQVYRTADGRHLAAAPLEDRFWTRFCELIELPKPLRDADADPQQAIAAVAERIAAQPAAHWRQLFAAEDVCCTIVAGLPEALADEHVASRGLFDDSVGDGDQQIPALPLPLAATLRDQRGHSTYPALGEGNSTLLGGN